jgi:hypothetical protein
VTCPAPSRAESCAQPYPQPPQRKPSAPTAQPYPQVRVVWSVELQICNLKQL